MADDPSLALQRTMLEELYEVYRKSPLQYGGWFRARHDDWAQRMDAGQQLKDAGYAEGTLGAGGDVELRLTARGAAFVRAGGFWAKPTPVVREAAVKRIGLENLHPLIVVASSDRFTDGHYADAIFAAFRAVEGRVRDLSGLQLTGKDLMNKALKAPEIGGRTTGPPPIDLRVEEGLSGENEQEGFRFLFVGAMVGIRNPKAHVDVRQDDPQRALEYLAFASMLMRRLDDAKVTPNEAVR
jgi:uncharacterized protein (TIGR02391 family)